MIEQFLKLEMFYSLKLYVYIYIYIYVCVCVCVVADWILKV